MILPVPSAHPCENSFPMKRFENGVPNIPLPDVKINVERKARTGNWEEAVDVNGTIISFITKENCKTSWMTRHSDQDGNPYPSRLKEMFMSPELTEDIGFLSTNHIKQVCPVPDL